MNEHPAIRRAKILAAYGRAAQASDELRRALEADPQSSQLRDALHEMSASRAKRNLRAGSWKHQAIGWILFAGSLTAAVAPIAIGIRAFRGDLPGASDSEILMGIYFVLFVAVVGAVLVGGMFVFYWLWFSYLKRLPPDERNFAEGCLALSMNLYSMEPQYSRIRKRMLGSARADA